MNGIIINHAVKQNDSQGVNANDVGSFFAMNFLF